MSWREGSVAADHTFACCLTHDVDRPYKTYQAAYNFLTDRDPSQLLDFLPNRNGYWTFDEILELESDLDVRSTWYFLDEQHIFRDRPVRDVFNPRAWQLYAGRYSLSDPRIQRLITRLDKEGWEVELHGSYESYRDADLLESEKETLERILGHEVTGVRQHYLNLDWPTTWIKQREAGFNYDATPGSVTTSGFKHGYEPLRPFDDEFVVFPVTIMDTTLPDPAADWNTTWNQCEELLLEARNNNAVMSLLWHPRYFSDDHPGFARLYRRLIERARELGAWVGPVGELYQSLNHTGPQIETSRIRES